MIPPVPAPRYKRKLITNEDSKHSSNKQNTSVSEQTAEILPPPRRKHKSRQIQEANVLISQNNFASQNKESTLLSNASNHEEIQTIHNSELSSNSGKNGILEIERSDCKRDSYEPNYLDENKSSNVSEMTDAFRDIVDSSILENFISNRVLDIPLVGSIKKSSFICSKQTLSTQDSDVDDSEENRVNSSFTENSATIVGVFYKPEYSSLKQMDEDRLVNPNVSINDSNELELTVWTNSFSNDGNKQTVVPPNESIRINNKMNKKDSEEDDSGVYFSDTKSPPHKNDGVELTDKIINDESYASGNPQFYKPFTCNERDTFDNNSSDLGPNVYNEMLDCFEAQTVSALRQEVTGRLSLCNESSKNKAVEDWLDNGEYLSKKRAINNNLSEYLRNMLEVDESERSLSPYPLSTVDESSDVSEKGPNDEIEFIGPSYTLEACTVPSSLSETRENRNVDASDKYLSSFVNNNSVNNVYNECTEVTRCNITSISLSEGSKVNINDVEDLCCIEKLRISNESTQSQSNFFFKEINHPPSVSPSIENGAVNQLINFFETILSEDTSLNREESPTFEDEIDDLPKEIDLLNKDSLLNSSNNSSGGENLDRETHTDDYNVKNTAVDCEENRDSNIGEVNCHAFIKCVNEYSGEGNILIENIIHSDTAGESEVITNTNGDVNYLDLGSNKVDMERNFENIMFHHSAEKLEQESTSPKDVKILTHGDENVINANQCNKYESFKSESTSFTQLHNDILNPADVAGNQVEPDMKGLSPPIEFADEKELSLTLDEHQVTELKQSYDIKVPNMNIFTKDLYECDDTNMFCPLKPTKIPVVILTDADIKSTLIGPIELHPSESISEDEDTDGMLNEICRESLEEKTTDLASDDLNDSNEEDNFFENAVTVVLEKNWGSIGLKIKGDAQGVVISDILVGGAADLSGLIFQGFLLLEKETPEQICSLQSA